MSSSTGAPDEGCCSTPLEEVCNLPEEALNARIAMIRRELLPHARAQRDLSTPGFPREGIRSEGFPREGIRSEGFPREGIRSEGFPREGIRSEGFEWDFEPTPAMRAELERLVALERECCGGLEWSVIADDPDALVLRVEGPGARDALAAIVGSSAPPPAGGARRFAKAAGLGVGAALFVCCVLPVAATALLGAAAAPLVGLDDPLVIGASAFVFGGAAWQVARRRERTHCIDC